MQSQAHQESSDPERQRKGEETTIAWVSYLNRGSNSERSNNTVTEGIETEQNGELSANQLPAINRVASATALQAAIGTDIKLKPEVNRPREGTQVSTDQEGNNFQSTGFFSWLFNQGSFFSRYFFFAGCTESILGTLRIINGSSSPASCFVIAGLYAGILGFQYWRFNSNERKSQEGLRKLESSESD